MAFRVTITSITPTTRPCTEYAAATLAECAVSAHQVHAAHEHPHSEGCGHLGVSHVITPTTSTIGTGTRATKVTGTTTDRPGR